MKLKVSNEGTILRSNDEIKYINLKQNYIKNNKTKVLFNLECNSSQFFVKKPAIEENSETAWLVCKFLKNSTDNTVKFE